MYWGMRNELGVEEIKVFLIIVKMDGNDDLICIMFYSLKISFIIVS